MAGAAATVGAARAGDLSRVQRARVLIGHHVRLQPRNFAIAVTGATVYAVGAVVASEIVGWVTDEVIVPRFTGIDVPTGRVVLGAVLVMAVGVLRAAAVIVRRVFATFTNQNVAAALSGQVVEQLAGQPLSWHGKRSDGDLVGRASVDTDAAVAVLSPLPFALGSTTLIIVASVWLLVTDPPMAIVAFAVFPLFLVVNVRYQRRVDVFFDKAQDELGSLSAGVHESFDGVQLVKAYGAEVRETERLSEIAGRVRDARTSAVRLRATFEAALDAVPALANVVLVVVGAWRVRAGALSVGEVTSLVYLFTLLVFPLRLVGFALGELPYSWAGFQRVREVADEPLEPDPAASLVPPPAGFGLRFEGVDFAYPDEPRVLHDVDLAVPTGTITAVVGPTGAGKSTLAALAAGLRAPTAGTVAAPAGSRALVFQEAYLLSGTLRDNVILGHAHPDGRAVSDDEVWAALALADAERFVRALPQQLDTVVGERGVSLSGGQRQRVALARALVRRPRLLVLDDVTSALDPATERTVLGNLRSSLSETTVLMVASRPSTIALADSVAFVRRGRVADHGQHGTLLQRNAEYRTLVDAFESDRRNDGETTADGAAGVEAAGDDAS